jgi:hypothetical protein
VCASRLLRAEGVDGRLATYGRDVHVPRAAQEAVASARSLCVSAPGVREVRAVVPVAVGRWRGVVAAKVSEHARPDGPTPTGGWVPAWGGGEAVATE